MNKLMRQFEGGEEEGDLLEDFVITATEVPPPPHPLTTTPYGPFLACRCRLQVCHHLKAHNGDE